MNDFLLKKKNIKHQVSTAYVARRLVEVELISLLTQVYFSASNVLNQLILRFAHGTAIIYKH